MNLEDSNEINSMSATNHHHLLERGLQSNNHTLPVISYLFMKTFGNIDYLVVHFFLVLLQALEIFKMN